MGGCRQETGGTQPAVGASRLSPRHQLCEVPGDLLSLIGIECRVLDGEQIAGESVLSSTLLVLLQLLPHPTSSMHQQLILQLLL